MSQTSRRPLIDAPECTTNRLGRLKAPLLFMHVPKCAGTSVTSFLRTLFHEHEICPAPPHGTWNWRASDVPGYRLYCGHFNADFVDEMSPAGAMLIMLRHPLSRVVSLYDYWRSHRWEYIRTAMPASPYNGPAIAKSGNLSAFLRTEFVHHDVYNPTARQLLGRRYTALWPDEDAIVSHSRQALRRFAWVGIKESFAPSIAFLSSILRVPMPKLLPKWNALADRSAGDAIFEAIEQTKPTDDDCRRILEGNRIDLAIYDEGRRILGEAQRHRCWTTSAVFARSGWTRLIRDLASRTLR